MGPHAVYPYSHFFFFQAEDGIRDLIVTGVQTCALPISHPMARDFPRTNPRVMSLDRSSRRQAAPTSFARNSMSLLRRLPRSLWFRASPAIPKDPERIETINGGARLPRALIFNDTNEGSTESRPTPVHGKRTPPKNWT